MGLTTEELAKVDYLKRQLKEVQAIIDELHLLAPLLNSRRVEVNNGIRYDPSVVYGLIEQAGDAAIMDIITRARSGPLAELRSYISDFPDPFGE